MGSSYKIIDTTTRKVIAEEASLELIARLKTYNYKDPKYIVENEHGEKVDFLQESM